MTSTPEATLTPDMAKGILGLAPTNGIDKTPAFALVDLMGREKQPLTAQLINLIIANMARYFEGYTPNGEGPDEEKLREIYRTIMVEFASLYPKQMAEEAHEAPNPFTNHIPLMKQESGLWFLGLTSPEGETSVKTSLCIDLVQNGAVIDQISREPGDQTRVMQFTSQEELTEGTSHLANGPVEIWVGTDRTKEYKLNNGARIGTLHTGAGAGTILVITQEKEKAPNPLKDVIITLTDRLSGISTLSFQKPTSPNLTYIPLRAVQNGKNIFKGEVSCPTMDIATLQILHDTQTPVYIYLGNNVFEMFAGNIQMSSDKDASGAENKLHFVSALQPADTAAPSAAEPITATETIATTKRKKRKKATRPETEAVITPKPETPQENITAALYKETSVYQNADGSISIHTVSPSDQIKKVEVLYVDNAGVEQPANWTFTQHVIPATAVNQLGERVAVVVRVTDKEGKQHTKLEHFNIVSTYPTYLPLGEDETYAFNPSQTLKTTDVVYDISLPAGSTYGANLNVSLENNRVVFITTGKIEITKVPIRVRTSTGTKVFNVTVAQDEKRIAPVSTASITPAAAVATEAMAQKAVSAEILGTQGGVKSSLYQDEYGIKLQIIPNDTMVFNIGEHIIIKATTIKGTVVNLSTTSLSYPGILDRKHIHIINNSDHGSVLTLNGITLDQYQTLEVDIVNPKQPSEKTVHILQLDKLTQK